jgi:transcription elongation factor GreA
MQIAEAIREAKSHGDLRENAAYHEAKLNQQRLEGQINDLERAVQMAKIVERLEASDESAQLGSKVTLLDLEFDDKFDVTLADSFEADPANGLISISSPLGEALIGKLAGAEFEVVAPAGNQRYRVVHVIP